MLYIPNSNILTQKSQIIQTNEFVPFSTTDVESSESGSCFTRVPRRLFFCRPSVRELEVLEARSRGATTGLSQTICGHLVYGSISIRSVVHQASGGMMCRPLRLEVGQSAISGTNTISTKVIITSINFQLIQYKIGLQFCGVRIWCKYFLNYHYQSVSH